MLETAGLSTDLTATHKDLKQTQERLQLIIDHIDTITSVNNFKQITAQNQNEIILKFKELLHTLDQLQPSSVVNMPGYEDLNDTRRKLQVVIGVLLNSLSQLNPAEGALEKPQKLSFSELMTELDDSTAFGGHQLLQDKAVWKSQITGDNGKLQAGARPVDPNKGNVGNASSQQLQIQLHLQPQPGGKVEGNQQVLLKLQLKAQPQGKGKNPGQLAELAAVQQMLEQEISKMERIHHCSTTVTTTANDADKFERTYTFVTSANQANSGSTSAVVPTTADSLQSSMTSTLASALENTEWPCTCCNTEQGCSDTLALRSMPNAEVPEPDGRAVDKSENSLVLGSGTGSVAAADADCKDVSLCYTLYNPISTSNVLVRGLARLELCVYWFIFFLCMIPFMFFWYWLAGLFHGVSSTTATVNAGAGTVSIKV